MGQLCCEPAAGTDLQVRLHHGHAYRACIIYISSPLRLAKDRKAHVCSAVRVSDLRLGMAASSHSQAASANVSSELSVSRGFVVSVESA